MLAIIRRLHPFPSFCISVLIPFSAPGIALILLARVVNPWHALAVFNWSFVFTFSASFLLHLHRPPLSAFRCQPEDLEANNRPQEEAPKQLRLSRRIWGLAAAPAAADTTGSGNDDTAAAASTQASSSSVSSSVSVHRPFTFDSFDPANEGVVAEVEIWEEIDIGGGYVDKPYVNELIAEMRKRVSSQWTDMRPSEYFGVVEGGARRVSGVADLADAENLQRSLAAGRGFAWSWDEFRFL